MVEILIILGYAVMGGITFGLVKTDDIEPEEFFAGIIWPFALPFLLGYVLTNKCKQKIIMKQNEKKFEKLKIEKEVKLLEKELNIK